MRTPIDRVKGKVIDVKNGYVMIAVPYNDWLTLTRREYKEAWVELIDSRPLSDKQRRACYALLRAIADYTGDGADSTKEYLKLKFLIEDLGATGDRLFSLSDAPMSLVAAFQSFLVRFILEWDIPTSFPLYELASDLSEYVYACLINKKCAVCGRRSDLHHIDAVGMGRDRHDIVHEGMEVIPLCREHHNEIHTLGDKQFLEKYHFDGGIKLDKTLCRIYKLKSEKIKKGR